MCLLPDGSHLKRRSNFRYSFCRTILFMILPALVIPRSLEMDGVRLSLTVGEAPSILMNLSYFFRFRKM